MICDSVGYTGQKTYTMSCSPIYRRETDELHVEKGNERYQFMIKVLDFPFRKA
jgi:hypothetical protein